MIRYALACPSNHEFESWFPSADAFDAQVERGLVSCPICDSPKVEKRIMAPSVARKDRAPAAAAMPASPEAIPEIPAQAVALVSERDRQMRALLRAMREHVTKNADHVGPRFAEEARRMHAGEIEHRSIYGEASPAEAKALIEEGIEVHPLPILPDDRN